MQLLAFKTLHGKTQRSTPEKDAVPCRAKAPPAQDEQGGEGPAESKWAASPGLAAACRGRKDASGSGGEPW